MGPRGFPAEMIYMRTGMRQTVSSHYRENGSHITSMHTQRVTNNGALQANRLRGPDVTVPSIHDVSA